MIGQDGIAAPQIATNIAHFARALRRAGLPIGPGQVIDAIRAVEVAGFTERTDFYWTLHALFVSRPDHRAVYDQVFRMFWRDPAQLEMLVAAMGAALSEVDHRPPDAAEARAAEAILAGLTPENARQDDPARPEVQLDMSGTGSDRERLKSLDFEQMTGAEMAQARRMIADLSLPVPPMLSRRVTAAPAGRLDRARTLRRALRRGGEIARLHHVKPVPRAPDLVILCDISGSMARYSRMLLHFVHAVSNAKGAGWGRVHAFTFGTRLTNITRHMARRDVDAALADAGRQAEDWEGGTRIGEALHMFNRDWSRRVMGQGALVILVTDGLDRGEPAHLSRAAERLHLSARQVIWLNPLLRFDGFEPKARGIRALLPHVDLLMSAHNIDSLSALGRTLSMRADGQASRMRRGIRPLTPAAAAPT